MKMTMMSMAAAMITGTAQADGPAGFSELSFEAPHHGRTVNGAIWYPAAGGGEPITYGENPVFYGTPAMEGADMTEGLLPVVLMSHGLGGNIRTLSWLSAGLAERGAIVVGVNHPNSSTGDFDLLAGLSHGTRAQDLQQALDVLTADPRFAGQLDLGRVMAAGFSYGGWTALSLGGLTGDLGAYADHCAAYGEASTHCADIMRGQVDLTALDPADWNASYRDARVTMVAAIDPALHWGLDEANVSGMIDDLQLIALGRGEDRLLATDFSASGSGFVALVPGAAITQITPANHFGALLPCKPAGPAILLEEGEPPVCDDPAGGNRAAAHAQIIDQIAGQLGL